MNDISEREEDKDSITPRFGGELQEEAEGASFWGNVASAMGLRKAVRARNGEASLSDTLEELAERTEEDDEPVSLHERSLFENIIALRDMTAEDVMIPRPDIVAVQKKISLPDLVSEMVTKAHSRLPVYGDTLDDVAGMVHIKDVLACHAAGRDYQLSSLLRRVLFVSPAIRVLDLLSEMRLSRTHMALVVDEFGGIDGLITIEDLVEEIVGEIDDEHDIDQTPKLIRLSDGCFVADARYEIEDLEEKLGFGLLDDEEDEDIDTLGGLVFSLAGRVPARGELIEHPLGLQFEVLDADPRRVRRLRIHLHRTDPALPPGEISQETPK
ncbi:hemolysin family protein [uncultured Thalassospira sp.]|jgi:CBS domain containing-hemolysin-like protein|uniref:hemolysin family protein n=1 Tax=uncultured Thalassospira sp. TaxID=404382 RepID=UPI0030DA9EFA|tara:strand:- start:3834 stop:4811 length:978 start_codon:yes stop_codon:yes gene_type:complete